MPQQDPLIRKYNFEEVNQGLLVELATLEAERCLDCSSSPCIQGCPVGVKISEFIDLVRKKEFLKAAQKIREDNVLPAITGRVCPQEIQCEASCVLGKNFEPVAIGYLERFVADYEKNHGGVVLPQLEEPTGKKVAIIGSGPAGLSAAGDLALKGHSVTVYEALHELGGVLIYGIPEFRLPKSIVEDEINNLRRLGIQFETDIVVGKTVCISELMGEEGFDAVFIATGAGLPKFLNIPGEDLKGVYSANEFLTRVNLLKAYLFPDYDEPVYETEGKVVAVIGGGNTALDAIRTAVRLKASKSILIYRRTMTEMPARKEEIEHAEEEGVLFQFLTQPLEFLGDHNGVLKAIRCQRMSLGPPDSMGRKSPVPIPDSEFIQEIDLCIVALGNGANPMVQSSDSKLKVDPRGYIKVNEDSLQTSIPGVFAGGDVVTGGATVILAMGAGRRAARSIDKYLRSPTPTR